MKTVKSLADLSSTKKIVDADGIDVARPAKKEDPAKAEPAPPNPMDRLAGSIEKLCERVAAPSAGISTEQMKFLAGLQQEIVDAVAGAAPKVRQAKKWNIKIHKEAGVPVAMTATPEY